MSFHLVYAICLSIALVSLFLIIRLVYKNSVVSFVGYSIILFGIFASICTYIFVIAGWKHVFWIIPLVAGLLVAILSYIYFTIRKPLNYIVNVAKDLSKGELKTNGLLKQKGELGSIIKTITDTVVVLKKVIHSVINSAQQVASASEEISKGNQDLSVRTEMQVRSMTDTASTMEEISKSIMSNNNAAENAVQLAEQADKKSKHGALVITDVIESMNEISSSSKNIADIINVINEITFQTNLLALNASVEAARAGEQGKGFAVVATEVRNLAQRSSKASKDIAELIKLSNEKVLKGSKSVQQADEALKDISNTVTNVSDLIAEISAANTEQMCAIEEVHKAVVKLDENSQLNAALVEESAATAEELSGQAQSLNTSVNFMNNV